MRYVILTRGGRHLAEAATYNEACEKARQHRHLPGVVIYDRETGETEGPWS